MGFEDWKKEIEKDESSGFEAWKAGIKVYEPPTEWLRKHEVATIPRSLTEIEKVGQAVTEVVAAPVRTIESMAAGGVGGLIRMGAEAVTMKEALIRANKMIPGSGTLMEGLMRKYGPKKAYSFYDRKLQKLADTGKKISDYWNEQANKGWEAPNPDIVEASWKDRPISKTVSAVSSGATSMGIVLGATALTKSPHVGLALLAASETGSMYNRLRDKDVPVGQASKLAQMAGAWTYATEKIPFDRLMKPVSRVIVDRLKQAGWEAAQEVVENFGHNLLEYWGYNYRKPEDIPTAVKAMYDHAMDGWMDALVGGFGAGGLASLAMPRGGAQLGVQITATRDIREQIEQSAASPQQKEQALRYIGDIETKVEEKIVNMFPDPVNSRESLERVGDQIAAELGVEGITWKWGTRRKKQIAFYSPWEHSITFNPNHPIFKRDISQFWTMRGTFVPIKNKTPGELNQDYIKRTIIHELGHKAVPAKYSKVNRRISHYAEFFDWVNGNISKMFEQTQQNTIPLHRDEAIGPITAPPTVEEITGKTMDELKPQTINVYRDADGRLYPDNASLRMEETEEGTKLISVETGKEVVLDQEASRSATINMPEPVVPPKIKRTGKNLLAMAHKIKREAGLSDNEYGDYAEAVTGKRSMKNMTKKERNDFVAFLEEGFGFVQELSKEDFDVPITVAGRATTMRQVYNAALKTVEGLKDAKTIPNIVKIGYAKYHPIRALKNFFFGIDNTPPYYLAKVLDGGVDNGIFSEVIAKGIEYGRKNTAAHTKAVTNAVITRLAEFGITPADLAKMSRAANPRLQTHQMISEDAATESFNIKINDKTYELTMADLIDIYLISEQKDGMRHLLNGGMVIEGVETGKLSEDQILGLRTRVENNPKAMQVTAVMVEVQELIWRPSLNQVSNRTDGKDIATVENWWGLEVFMPRRMPGKTVELKVKNIEVNLLENKSILHDRTKSKAPLIIRDALRRFNAFESAVAEYVGMAEPSRISRTLINDVTLSKMLNRKGYDEVRKRIFNIHKQAQSIPRSEGNFTAWFAHKLPNLYRAVLYLNARVIASQKTSTFSYGAYVSPEYASSMVAGFSWQAMQETMDLSDIAWDRYHMSHSSLELGEAAQSDAVLRMWSGGKASDKNRLGWTLKISDLSALADGMDMAQREYQDARKGTIKGLSAEWWLDKGAENLPEADIELWRKIQKEGEKADPDEKQRTEAWRKIVSDRAEWLWQRTQPSWDKWNRSNLTSQRGGRRLFLIFRSFHEKQLTIINDAKLRYENSQKTVDDKKILAQQAGAVLTSYTVNKFVRLAILALIVGELETPAKYLEEFITGGVNMFPVFGKVIKSTVNKFIATVAGEKPSYTGEPIESYPVNVVNQVLKSPADMADGVAHLINGENDEATKAFIRGTEKIAEGTASLTGLPGVHIAKRIKKRIMGEKKKQEYKF